MMILAPLRGVTIRSFRETFAEEITAAGFTEAITPFITAMPGVDPMKDRELRRLDPESRIKVTPQFIGKDPAALRSCLERIKAAGFNTADLNCGCPYPMVRNKGRGSGLLKTPKVLMRMLEVGCDVMGPGNFSIKARLGIDRNDELLALMPDINMFPLRFLTVHARNARQMYDGDCDLAALEKIRKVAKMPVVPNGDIPYPVPPDALTENSTLMIGRGFIRHLGSRPEAKQLLTRYLEASQKELHGDTQVLGRMKELIAYWKELPQWKRRWDIIKLTRTIPELRMAIS